METSVSRFVEAEIAAGTVPGAALIVARDGKSVVERAWGTFADRQRRGNTLTIENHHFFYSFSKLVAATVIAQVWQDGGFALDRPLAAYVPAFTGGGKDRITVRHLLTHAAGLPTSEGGAVDTDEGWERFFQALCTRTVEWKPGSRSAYHALTGHFLAAYLACRVAGKPWERLCQERLFDPLGARSLSFGSPFRDPKLAWAPQPTAFPVTPEGGASGFAGHPAAGCFGSIQDALKVVQLHVDGGVWKGKRLLDEATVRELHTVQYAGAIARARKAGRTPSHETWGLGFLLRGDGPAMGGHGWFGFQNQGSPTVFGHAGIDTVIGVGDPASRVALFFVTTDSPKSPEKTIGLRNGVTDAVMAHAH